MNKILNEKIVPIVFAFDDNYALPASIAIKSLIEHKKSDTKYEIFVLHDNLKQNTIKNIEKISKITWINIDKKLFKNAPTGWSGIEAYYRLIIHDVIPNKNKIIWSDVDVLFQGDLSDIYNTNIDKYDWVGIKAEKNDGQQVIHTHFSENKNDFIMMNGFMIINAEKMRKNNMTEKFLKTIDSFGDRLKMFELDVLNLCSNNIGSAPFEYCVLENLYHNDIKQAPEYVWLKKVYTDDELNYAKANPIIIHYAGGLKKIWLRKHDEIPKYYWHYIKNSPFYIKEMYFPDLFTKIKYKFLYLAMKMCLIKKYRKNIKKYMSNYTRM